MNRRVGLAQHRETAEDHGAMRALVLATLLIVSAIISLVAGIRSRVRVRKMLADDVEAGVQCAIDRVQVKHFFGETQVLRASLEDILLNPASGLPIVDDDDNAALRHGDLERLFGEWHVLFSKRLDDEDRHALSQHGVTQAQVDALHTKGRQQDPSGFARLVTELGALETRMSEGQASRGYR